MADGRKCSECGGSLEGKASTAKTCSNRCRVARTRRQSEARASGRTVGALVTDDAERATQELLREELRPVVREAITKEVLDGIHNLIGHVPRAVAVAAALLESTDEKTRYDAAKLILQHTTGNKSVVPDVNAGQGNDLIVKFALPRPEDAQEGIIEGEVVTEKQCDSCGQTKPLAEFVGGSERCSECYSQMQKLIKQLDDGSGSVPPKPGAAAVSP